MKLQIELNQDDIKTLDHISQIYCRGTANEQGKRTNQSLRQGLRDAIIFLIKEKQRNE